jgi:predicted DNA-binding transcriptional regulator AlpA
MARLHALPPMLAPRLLSRLAASEYACVSPNTFDKMVAAGALPRPRKLVGKRKAWDVRELDQSIDALPHDGIEISDDDGWEE